MSLVFSPNETPYWPTLGYRYILLSHPCVHDHYGKPILFIHTELYGAYHRLSDLILFMLTASSRQPTRQPAHLKKLLLPSNVIYLGSSKVTEANAVYLSPSRCASPFPNIDVSLEARNVPPAVVAIPESYFLKVSSSRIEVSMLRTGLRQYQNKWISFTGKHLHAQFPPLLHIREHIVLKPT